PGMPDRIALAQDLLDCRGGVLARRGLVISPEAIDEAAGAARPGPRHPLAATPLAGDLRLPLAEPAWRHLFRTPAARAAAARAVLAVELPEPLHAELSAMKRADPIRYRHALATAAVAARVLEAAVGEARSLPEPCAAALLHDLGMRHLPQRLLRSGDGLQPGEVTEVAAHPLLGAFHLARALGAHPAVEAALTHHWRSGQGYPRLSRAPSRSLEVVAVASAFVALTQPRPFRSGPYDARGAVDLLVAEASAGQTDPTSVRLLVHALRGGEGEPQRVRYGRDRLGHAPAANRHSPIAAVTRARV
ncbi:MAG TPA: HD domain-containing phosphohydrolase, partial [Anaeromyxobacteraceae bacterium]|nr:HD domain-containing phosphohydrolase [Anaeromyxobacteraceae bacterium]